MEERIHYSQEQMKLELDAALRELNAFRFDRKFRTALGENFIQKMDAWENRIRSQKDAPFTLVVIGDFKRGKSTLINALLGEEVVTSDVNTETVSLNTIRYGAECNEAVLSGNRRARLSSNELKREELEKVIQNLGEPINSLELQRPNELLKKITIIDTPGTGDAMQDFSEMVQASLIQADAVIYVFNVQYPLSKTEQLFLKSAVLPQKYTKLFMVGNFGDILSSKADYQHVREFLEKRISGFLPNEEIFMVSALDELCCKLGEESAESEVTPILREQFQKLRDSLNKLVEEREDAVVLSRMQRLTNGMVSELGETLDALKKGVLLDLDQAAELKNEHEKRAVLRAEQSKLLLEEIQDSVHSMQQEAAGWMGKFTSRMSAECSTLSNESANNLKQYFEFYCVDKLQQAMNTCWEYHEDKIYELLDEVSTDVSSRIGDVLPESRAYMFRLDLDNRSWTKGDTVGLFTSLISGTGLLSTAASMVVDGITGAMRDKEIENRVPEIVKQISRKMLGLNQAVSDTLEKQYGALLKSTKKLIEDYTAAEYEKEKKLVEQTVYAATIDATEKQELSNTISEAYEILNRIRIQ